MKMKTESTAYECALMLKIETPHYEYIKRKGESAFAIFSPFGEEDSQYLLKIKIEDGAELVLPATIADLENESVFKSVEKIFVSREPPPVPEPEPNDFFNERLTQIIDGSECPEENQEVRCIDNDQPGCSKDLVEERIKCHHYRVAIGAKIREVEHEGQLAFVFENPPGIYDNLKLIPIEKFQKILLQNQEKVQCMRLGAKNLHTPENPITLPDKMNKPKRKYTRRNYKKDRDDKEEEETPKGRGRGRPPKVPSKRPQENVLRDEDFNDEVRKRKAEIEEAIVKIKEEKLDPIEPHSDVDVVEEKPKPKKRRGRPPKPQKHIVDEQQEEMNEEEQIVENFP